MSTAVPEHTGVSFLEAWFSDVENRHPDIAELVGPGSAATVDDAIRTYEKTMLPRSTELAKALGGGAEHLLSADVPDFGGGGVRS